MIQSEPTGCTSEADIPQTNSFSASQSRRCSCYSGGLRIGELVRIFCTYLQYYQVG